MATACALALSPQPPCTRTTPNPSSQGRRAPAIYYMGNQGAPCHLWCLSARLAILLRNQSGVDELRALGSWQRARPEKETRAQ